MDFSSPVAVALQVCRSRFASLFPVSERKVFSVPSRFIGFAQPTRVGFLFRSARHAFVHYLRLHRRDRSHQCNTFVPHLESVPDSGAQHTFACVQLRSVSAMSNIRQRIRRVFAWTSRDHGRAKVVGNDGDDDNRAETNANSADEDTTTTSTSVRINSRQVWAPHDAQRIRSVS